jgi:lipid II:glycine glycyltransferase (peptidoglycan interpeptide bridge formation enzyme)
MILRVHQQSIVNCLVQSGFNYQIEAGDFILDIAERPPEQIWNKVFRKDERNDIRYFEKYSLSLGFAQHESEYSDFFNLYQESMLRQDYKPISHDFFKNLRSTLGQQFRVISFTSENKVIAGLAILCDTKNSEVRFNFVGYQPQKGGRSFTQYIYWKAVNWASENGFKYVNFGRTSPDETNSVHRLKQKFGGEFVPEYKFVLPVNSTFVSIARSINKIFQVRSRVSS